MEMGEAGRGTTRGTEERTEELTETRIKAIRAIEITTSTRMDIMDRGTWRTMPQERERPA